ncbi:MAG: MarR family winged helix-turn-helix transcriptional regulator [Thermomicrobiales bacterium]
MAERLRKNFAGHAADSGLSVSQAKVLMTLQSSEPSSMRSLAAALDYDASNLTLVVDRLEAMKLVERRADAHDRRIKAVGITEGGQSLLWQFQQQLQSSAGPLQALNDSQLRELKALLQEALSHC